MHVISMAWSRWYIELHCTQSRTEAKEYFTKPLKSPSVLNMDSGCASGCVRVVIRCLITSARHEWVSITFSTL